MAPRQLSVLGLACLLLLATGALVAEAAATCGVEEGMTYYGNPGNFKTIRWPKKSTKYSWQDCCKECKKRSNCKKFSFYQDRFGNVGCSLYNDKATTLTPSYSNTSGKRCSC